MCWSANNNNIQLQPQRWDRTGSYALFTYVDPNACTMENRPVITDLEPSTGGAGTTVTIRGDWRVGAGVFARGRMLAQCSWRTISADNQTFDGYRGYQTAVMVGTAVTRPSSATCTVPERHSSIPGNAAPLAGATVAVSVHVWYSGSGTYGGTASGHPLCWSGGAEAVSHTYGRGTYGYFTYDDGGLVSTTNSQFPSMATTIIHGLYKLMSGTAR